MAPASLSASFQSLPLIPTNQIGPFWCCFLSGWVRVCSGTLWVSPTNSPVRLGVSPAATSTTMGVFNLWFEALFPCAGALSCVVCCAPLPVPPSLSMCECGATGSASNHLVGSASCSLAYPIPQSTTSLGPPAATLLRVLSAQAAPLHPSYQSG